MARKSKQVQKTSTKTFATKYVHYSSNFANADINFVLNFFSNFFFKLYLFQPSTITHELSKGFIIKY